MFERFRKSREDGGDGAVAATDRRAAEDRDLDLESTRVDDARFERESPGERDRGVTAGGGDADLAAERPFEREEMARGAHDGDADDGARTTALDRDAARDDLTHDDDARGRDAALAAGAAGAGAAMAHDRDEDEGMSPGEHDRGVAAGDEATDTRRDGQSVTEHDDDGRDDRHEHTGRDAALAGGAAGAGAAVAHDRHDETARAYDDREGDGLERHAPIVAPATLDTMRARQRDRFGGFQWGSDFFGWLCAIGLASLLTAALVGAGVALGLSTSDAQQADTAETIGLGGGIALLVVLAIAWFCGGYVAGRMARFDGARQGIGVWLWTVLAALAVAAAAAIGGTEYDLFERLNLPRIAVGGDTLTAGGAIAGAAAIVVTLVAAVVGGKVGERFHKRVDRVAADEYLVER